MINWEKGENPSQIFYDAKVEGKYLLVFANKDNPNNWMGMVNFVMLSDKKLNDRQRKKEHLPAGCPLQMLKSHFILHSNSPEYMMDRVEYAFANNLTEIMP